MKSSYLRWFLLVGILYTTFIFLWLILTPSLSEEVFFLWYSFERFFLNTLVGFILIAEFMGLFLVKTRWLNNLFSSLMNSQAAFWFVFGSFIITLTIILVGTIFIVLGSRSVILDQIIPIVSWVYLLLFEIILFQHVISEGKITQPVWAFVVLARNKITNQIRNLYTSIKKFQSNFFQFISDLVKIIRLYNVHSFRYLFIILVYYLKKVTILSILHGMDYCMFTLLARLKNRFCEDYH